MPWATAGMHAKQSEVSKMVQIQLLNREDKEGVKYMEGELHSLNPCKKNYVAKVVVAQLD